MYAKSVFAIRIYKYIAVIVTVLAALFFVECIVSAQQVLKIATEGTYPPCSFFDASGKLQGFDVDISNALCAKMGMKCDIIAQDWDGIIPGLLAKKYDAIVASMSVTPERKKKVGFTKKYKSSISIFVGKKGSNFDTSPMGMKDKIIGVQRGSSQDGYITENYKFSTIKRYDTTDAVELDLVAGRLDVLFANKFDLYANFFKKTDSKSFDYLGKDMQGGLLGEGNAIAIRIEDNELRERLNKAIDEIHADGTYEKISLKYWPFPVW